MVACLSGGGVIFFGAHRRAEAEVEIHSPVLKQVDLMGTMMGNPGDFRALLRACGCKTGGRSSTPSGPLAEAAGRARAWMRASEQFGKLVLTV